MGGSIPPLADQVKRGAAAASPLIATPSVTDTPTRTEPDGAVRFLEAPRAASPRVSPHNRLHYRFAILDHDVEVDFAVLVLLPQLRLGGAD